MDYEEKYKDLVKAVKELQEANPSDEGIQNWVNENVPELTENKDDMIRKAILEHMQLCTESIPDRDKFIAWLEKQGRKEQLYIRFGEIPTNEKSKIYQGEIEVGTENGVSVYPAFKTDKGDIVLGLNLPITKTTLYTQQHLIEYDDRPCYLVKGDYVGKDTDGQPLINNVSIIKKIDSYRVKEKKQGQKDPCKDCKHPMLNCINFPCLKKQEYQGKTALEAIKEEDIKPATKEQRDTLMKAMNKAGYEWDAEKKELKKIEQKPAWSEEDDVKLNDTINLIEQSGNVRNIREHYISWLKSLKERAVWKPSEEQLYWLKYAADSTSDTEKGNESEVVLNELYEQLKKLTEK